MNSLIIPVYRNADTIVLLLDALSDLSHHLGDSLEVVFVVDGSPDKSHEILARLLPKMPFRAQLLRHSRNFGSFPAIRSGLVAARGQHFAVMAADLQEPPELIRDFFRILAEESVDLVCGSRKGRNDPGSTRLAANVFWGLYRTLVQPEVPVGGVDVFACNAVVRDALLQFNESNSSLIGQLFWLGFRRRDVPYERRARAGEGKSAWTFRKKWSYMMDSIFSFTNLPINLLLWMGTIGVFMSLVISFVVLTGWTCNWIEVQGYTPIMLAIAFSTSLNLLATGIIGNYLWRTFENTKGRSLAVIMSREVFNQND